MSTSFVKVRVDDRDVLQGFDRMKAAAQSRAFFQAMKPQVKADIKEHGKQERGPDGQWPARDPEYLAGKTLRGRGGKTLKRRKRRAPRQMLGKLTTSIRMRAQSGALIIQSAIPWGGAHQEGSVVGRGAILPARPFLYFSDELVDLAGRAYAAFVTSAFPKGARARINV